MKPNRLFLIIIAVFLLVGGIISIVYTQCNVVEVQEFDLVAIVEPGGFGMGFNGSQLMFGKVSPGNGLGIRNLVVHNNASFPVVATFKYRGNISQYVSVNETAPVFGPHSSREIQVIFEPARDAMLGNYWGTLTVIMSKI